MTHIFRILVAIFYICIFLLPPGVLSAKPTPTVRIWLLQGTPNEGRPGLSRTEVLPISSTPELASLRALAGGPDHDLKAALIETLLDTQDLRSLDDLFFSKQSPREEHSFLGQVILWRQLAFRLGLSLKLLSPGQAALRVTLLRTKEGVIRPEKDDRTMLRNAYNVTRDEEKMDLIVDETLTLGFDESVLLGVPFDRRPYFLMIKLTADEPEPRRKASPTLKLPPTPSLVPAPPAVEKVLPAYPDELRRRGIKGELGVRIATDETGSVRMVQIQSPLHPYLDYAASQAFWRWRFEPVLKDGKAVPAAFDLKVRFDPAAYAEETTAFEADPEAEDEATKEKIERTLAACAAYCRKLADAALFYVSEETIREITHGLVSADRLAEIALRPRDTAFQVNESPDGQMTGWLGEHPQIIERRRADRLVYSCDYQMIRRFGEIEERRIVLKKNGRRIADRVELLEDSRYAALSPVVSALSIFDEYRQPLFHFRIVKEDKVSGRGAFILEAVPKLGDADGVRSAKAWLEKESGRILRCEIEGVPLDGYEDVLSEAVLLNIRPFFLRTYEYRVENGGVLLPDRTAVRIEYPSLIPNRRETKSKIDIACKDFKFFTVDTGHEIIK